MFVLEVDTLLCVRLQRICCVQRSGVPYFHRLLIEGCPPDLRNKRNRHEVCKNNGKPLCAVVSNRKEKTLWFANNGP